MALYTKKGASIDVRNGVTSINGFLILNQTNVYLTSGNFSKGAAVFNPNHTGSAISAPDVPTAVPGTSYISATSTPVPNYIIGNSLGLSTYTFSVTNGIDTTAYTNGTYTVSASSLYDATSANQMINLFNGLVGGVYKNWRSATTYTGAVVSSCPTYTGSVSTDVNGTTYLGEWCQIQLPYSINITSYKYFTFNNTNGRIALVGSNDGINWSLINVQASVTGNGGSPAGNTTYTNIANVPSYFSYIRLISLVGATNTNFSTCPSNLILKGNVNIGNTVKGIITSATYGTINSTSVTIILTGTYTSFNLVRTNITLGNVVVTYYGLVGSTYVDSKISTNSIYTYSIVPVNITSNGTAYLVGTVKTPPAAPTLFALSSRPNNNTLIFTFTPSPGTDITYTAFTSVGGYSGTSTSSPITINNLPAASSYTVAVRATNSFGTSSPSNTITTVTLSSAPIGVTGLNVISKTHNSAVIGFNASNNAASYTVYTNTASTVSGTSSPLTLTGLNPNTNYTVYATATNNFGTTPPSSIGSLNTRIAPPTNLALTNDPSGQGIAVLTFSISAGSPAAYVTKYTATLSNGVVVTNNGNLGSIAFNGLQPNTPYTATIVANAASTTWGNSISSNPITFSIPSNPYVFSGSLATQKGFNNFGARSSILNGISYTVFDGSSIADIKYAYFNLGQSLLGKTIQFSLAYTANSRCFFGCNINGVGNVLRIGSTNTGTNTFFTSSTSWTTISTETQVYNSSGIYGPTFIPIKFVISNTGSLTLYIYNALKTIVSGSYTINEQGYYFGFGSAGDNSQVALTDVTITPTSTSSSIQAIPIPGYSPVNTPGVLTTTFTVTTGSDSTSYTNGTYVISASSIANNLTTTSITNPITLNPGTVSWLSAATYAGTSFAYNGTVSTIATGITYLGEWYQIQFPYLFKLFTIDILTNSTSQTWTFVGSSDGITWDLILKSGVTGGGINVFFTLLIDSPNYYYYYRIISSTGFSGNSASIAKGITMKGDIM
jgi:hypothetical protein